MWSVEDIRTIEYRIDRVIDVCETQPYGWFLFGENIVVRFGYGVFICR